MEEERKEKRTSKSNVKLNNILYLFNDSDSDGIPVVYVCGSNTTTTSHIYIEQPCECSSIQFKIQN